MLGAAGRRGVSHAYTPCSDSITNYTPCVVTVAMSRRQTKPDSIKRKAHVPESVRTAGKDDAADYIQTEVVEAGRWPMEYSEMADESGWSRQHIRNTIEQYFSVVEESEPETCRLSITVPENVDRASYLQGWIDGYESR